MCSKLMSLHTTSIVSDTVTSLVCTIDSRNKQQNSITNMNLYSYGLATEWRCYLDDTLSTTWNMTHHVNISHIHTYTGICMYVCIYVCMCRLYSIWTIFFQLLVVQYQLCSDSRSWAVVCNHMVYVYLSCFWQEKCRLLGSTVFLILLVKMCGNIWFYVRSVATVPSVHTQPGSANTSSICQQTRCFCTSVPFSGEYFCYFLQALTRAVHLVNCIVKVVT
jgi:hypothetical protein